MLRCLFRYELVLAIALTAFLALLTAGASGADSGAPAIVVLTVQTDIMSPKGSSSSATTIIAPLSADDEETYEAHGFKFQLLVTDRRNDEFSVVISLVESPEPHIDSATVLVSSEKAGTFEFTAGSSEITGTIALRQVIAQPD